MQHEVKNSERRTRRSFNLNSGYIRTRMSNILATSTRSSEFGFFLYSNKNNIIIDYSHVTSQRETTQILQHYWA